MYICYLLKLWFLCFLCTFCVVIYWNIPLWSWSVVLNLHEDYVGFELCNIVKWIKLIFQDTTCFLLNVKVQRVWIKWPQYNETSEWYLDHLTIKPTYFWFGFLRFLFFFSLVMIPLFWDLTYLDECFILRFYCMIETLFPHIYYGKTLNWWIVFLCFYICTHQKNYINLIISFLIK